jgi:glutathione synthase/RimK-type ligase-like ATP-grasp enzyme
MAEGSDDDCEAAELLGADFCVWDDETVDWNAYDRVVLRSVWDYSRRALEFLGWCRSVGPARLRNRPELVAFSADKRYLTQLSVPSVPTRFVSPGEAAPVFDGEVVVKPNVSAGARDTGRFGPAKHAEALALIDRIQASGRVALVQPYLPAVDVRGETAVVFIGGELSHVLHKRAVLGPDEIAPVAGNELAVAAAMLRDDLVRAGSADAAQRALAIALHAEISDRFESPLYLRIDLIDGPDGVPLVLELEAIEPSLYLTVSPGASERLARAVRVS